MVTVVLHGGPSPLFRDLRTQKTLPGCVVTQAAFFLLGVCSLGQIPLCTHQARTPGWHCRAHADMREWLLIEMWRRECE